MRKRLLICIVLLAYPAMSQMTSGTIVIFNFTRDQLTVAADSRGVNTDTLVPHDSECKISTFGHRLIFTSTGNARHRRSSGSVPGSGWDNTMGARTAFRSARKLRSGEAQMRMISTTWADAMVANWRSYYQAYPDKVTRLVSGNGGLTVGAFAEANHGTIYFRAAEIKFDRNRASPDDPIAAEFEERLGSCWACGPGSKVCALGKHFDVAAKFCSERKLGEGLKVRTQLKKASNAVKLAVKIAELTIDAYSKTPGDVGGMVDAVTLKSDGTITWNAIKEYCPGGQE